MWIMMDKINFEKLKEIKKWYEEHPEEYGKMIKEGFYPPLDYLKIVDEIYLKGECF